MDPAFKTPGASADRKEVRLRNTLLHEMIECEKCCTSMYDVLGPKHLLLEDKALILKKKNEQMYCL